MLDQAKSLYQEHTKEYVFYNPMQRSGFIRRLRNLAKRIACNEEANYQTVICLDVIATRLNIHLRYADE